MTQTKQPPINPERFTDALAGKAECYMLEYYFFPNLETDCDAKVINQADRAILLAPDAVRAYAAKSAYLYFSHRAGESLRTANAGLAINPSYAALYGCWRSTPRNLLSDKFEQAKV